jgi:hypothetical protein
VRTDRAAGVHGRDVRGRGRRELRGDLGHVEPAHERVRRVALAEATAERVEQHHPDRTALAAREQALDGRRHVRERSQRPAARPSGRLAWRR